MRKLKFIRLKDLKPKLAAVFKEHFGESVRAVAPVSIIIVALCFTIAPIPNSAFLSFIVGVVLLVLGMGLFNLGAQTAMLPIGERIGAYITKSRKLWLVILVAFTIGTLITISEPDLYVLADQLPSIPNLVLLISVAVGVGLFLVVALLRTLFYLPLSSILVGCYAVIFVLAAFVPRQFLAVAFDAGGVTTGPMTVPFIMALGVGAASIRSDKHAENDTFGLVALSSVGPILTVLILGLVYRGSDTEYMPPVLSVAANSQQIATQFIDFSSGFPHFAKESLFALGPIAVFFLIFQFFALKMNRRPLVRILTGLLCTFIGLILFLTGVNVGFMPTGFYLGNILTQLDYKWIIVPIAMLIGFFIVAAEPAVQVLNKQVEEMTAGAIPSRVMKFSLSIGVSLSLGLSMVRLLTGISILWFLLPGYAIALAMTFFVPKIFTAIAFDSGGVASGPMTATFLLPFAIGVAMALGRDVATNAFGVVAMVAMTPIITIQIVGLVYKLRARRKPIEAEPEQTLDSGTEDADIIEFD